MKLPSLSYLWPDTRAEWMTFLFIIAFVLISGLLIWQLMGTDPARWCGLAEVTSPENTNACLAVLQGLITVKDHTIIGLLAILGTTVLSLVVVALGVTLKASGPGGTNVDISANETTIETPETTVVVPTPPSEETK